MTEHEMMIEDLKQTSTGDLLNMVKDQVELLASDQENYLPQDVVEGINYILEEIRSR